MSSHYDRIAETRVNINETTSILKDNISKMTERGQKIEDLSEMTDSSASLYSQSFQLKKQMWLKKRNLLIVLAVIIIIIIIVITILISEPWKKWKSHFSFVIYFKSWFKILIFVDENDDDKNEIRILLMKSCTYDINSFVWFSCWILHFFIFFIFDLVLLQIKF